MTPVAQELWRHPDPTSVPMWGFLTEVDDRHGLALKDYSDLYRWSVDNVDVFWEEVWRFVGVKASVPFERVSFALISWKCDLTLTPFSTLR